MRRAERKPRLLDLFCGAGGAGAGYQRAGFEVVGVDLVPQPDYPFEFHQADAMTFPLDGFDAVHASPPCHDLCALASLHDADGTGWMLAATVERFRALRVPWVVENVEGPAVTMGGWWFTLCGSSFGLRTRRHRRFGSSVLMLAPQCDHRSQGPILGVYGASDGAHPPGFIHPGNKRGPRQATTIEAREIMGMPWATKRHGITQAIPPAYAEWVGARLLESIRLASSL